MGMWGWVWAGIVDFFIFISNSNSTHSVPHFEIPEEESYNNLFLQIPPNISNQARVNSAAQINEKTRLQAKFQKFLILL